jgi:hypothetical protein
LNLPSVIGQTLSFQSRTRVQAGSAPDRGDRTLRFPVVIAVSRELLFSLDDTYSTALFAMMSTPERSLAAV